MGYTHISSIRVEITAHIILRLCQLKNVSWENIQSRHILDLTRVMFLLMNYFVNSCDSI